MKKVWHSKKATEDSFSAPRPPKPLNLLNLPCLLPGDVRFPDAGRDMSLQAGRNGAVCFCKDDRLPFDQATSSKVSRMLASAKAGPTTSLDFRRGSKRHFCSGFHTARQAPRLNSESWCFFRGFDGGCQGLQLKV